MKLVYNIIILYDFPYKGEIPTKREMAGRVHLIDEARGLAIVLMVIYHTFYDLVVLWGVSIPVFSTPLVQGLVVFFAGLFIFISGTACCFSRSNWKRGAICLGLGMGLTLVTWLFLPESFIRFGILHLLGCCMLLYPLLEPLLRRIPPWAGIPACLLLWALACRIPEGYCLSLELPRALYQTHWLFWLGFPGNGFFSADYFPMLPWLFCFLAGAFFGRSVQEGRMPPWIRKPHCPPLAFIGRHTMIIYLLHQPIVYSILWIAFR